MKQKVKVVITNGYRWSYFQWFILGLYRLEKQGIIELKMNLPIGSKLLSILNNNLFLKIVNKIHKCFENDSYNMDGYIYYPDGQKKTFTIDSADAPYLFDSDKLEKYDVYFKIQCPKNITSVGFPLTDEIIIPWLDHRHVDKNIKKLTQRGERRKCDNFEKNRHKIKPLMFGPRALSEIGFSQKRLETGYNNYLKSRKTEKNKKIMCYFGNSMGPIPEKEIIKPDYDWEGDIMGYYQEKISHPNEKRGKVADILSGLGDCDARVITRTNSDRGVVERKDLVIPLNRFCDFISDFQYNINVSGYRRSMPNRFIESIMVGTSVLTDKLEIKWYKPFDENEVKETIEMGYLKMDEVDWEKFTQDIMNLSKPNSKKIIENFEEKWAPEVVAQYIIDTVIEEGN